VQGHYKTKKGLVKVENFTATSEYVIGLANGGRFALLSQGTLVLNRWT